MTRRNCFRIAATAGAVFLIGGCSSHHKPLAPVANSELAPLRQELTTIQSRTSERGIVLTIPDAIFAVGKANMTESAQRDLVAIAAYLKEHPDQNLLIEGHTDSMGTKAYNHELSLRRGTAVETFFLRNGIDPERLQVRGLGEDHPIASNATASGRQQNRRVEVVMSNAHVNETVRAEDRVFE